MFESRSTQGAVALLLSCAFFSGHALAQPAPAAVPPADAAPADAAPAAPAATPPTAPVAATDPEKEKRDAEDRAYQEKRQSKHVILELNPIGIAIGRYSIQAQILFAKRHAIVVNPYFNYTTAEITTSSGTSETTYKQRFVGGGAELGYRFYSNSKLPAGFFVGPSVIAGYYSAGGDDIASKSFATIGGALDIGGQAMIGPGVILSGGFGLQYTKATEDFSDLPFAAAVIAGGGFRPRFLFSVGYAF